jgi:hypothetical protein
MAAGGPQSPESKHLIFAANLTPVAMHADEEEHRAIVC